jgi:hypothetical protein
MAYLDAQTSINASTDTSRAGIESKQFDSVQTLGNMGKHIGLHDDAQASLYAAQAQSFADDVRISFFGGTPDGSTDLKRFNDSTYVNTNFGGDVVIDSVLADAINSKSEQVVIYSVKDIKISNTVTQLNAILVADGKVDTCAEADQGGDNGQLLENCYNSLVINGVVYSKRSIALDRVYGGGSVNGMNLDPGTLMQRAEIFSFDPKIVEWGYDYKRETQPYTTTYIEELSTRY